MITQNETTIVTPKLTYWSTLLLVLAVATALFSVAAPLSLYLNNRPIVLSNHNEIWKTTLGQLPALEANLCMAVILLPNLIWAYAIMQIAKLALYYRRGMIFGQQNISCFIRMGISVALMGIMGTLALPAIGYLFYYRGISPWLPDMPLMAILEPDLIMAGAFFYVLGKIMSCGTELQDRDRLTI